MGLQIHQLDQEETVGPAIEINGALGRRPDERPEAGHAAHQVHDVHARLAGRAAALTKGKAPNKVQVGPAAHVQ